MTTAQPPTTAAAPVDVPLLIAGRWQAVSTPTTQAVHNPSTGEVIARTPLCDATVADEAVRAAREALPGWADTPAVERARVLFRFRDLIEQHHDTLARLVTREHGKTLAESRAEVQRGLEMVEFATGIPSLLAGQTFPRIAGGVDGETNRHPVGVCVGITPYNFPHMVPLWMFPVALACGNTFILKPSEKVPLSSVRLGELLMEAGLPGGVFSIVHGGKPMVDALLTHPGVNAISFVGSTAIAKYVYTTGCAHGKRVQAAGGAKNHLVIMPDADLDQSIKALAASAYGCAGQRCMAGSVAVAVGKVGDELVEGLADFAGRMKVGRTDTNDAVDMGPVISAEHRTKIALALDIAEREGATLALDGRSGISPAAGSHTSGGAFLLGPSILDRVTTDMAAWKDEMFGPVLSVVRATSLEHAIAIGDQCPYGNGASIFTRDGHAARAFKHRFNAGMIGINVGVPAPMAWLPFTGWNHSFFGDLHLQGAEGVHFYTRQKTTLTRWFASAGESHQDPVWKTT